MVKLKISWLSTAFLNYNCKIIYNIGRWVTLDQAYWNKRTSLLSFSSRACTVQQPFMVLIDSVLYWASVYVDIIHFHISLIFVGKTLANPKYF
jgi:hypothetical protein